MARLRNLSNSFLKPFQSSDNSNSRSFSQPLSLQTSDTSQRGERAREQGLDNSYLQESPVPITPTRQGDSSGPSRPTTTFFGTAEEARMARDVEELRPVFSFLSSHSNKLYQEGYFLKLNDLDTNGKPNADRSWTECFAQLVGTVLSLWDAAALDAAGQDGEVAPTFINLADASIKMIETLPTRNQDVQPLQNVLSISTAGKNRYLLHFNSLHSLTQWTAGIRLAMFEHASLQELYTGSLIAGKGRHLNNIKPIMEKTKFRIEDWARVRFGAGTPWRRCWCVVDPPDEKEIAKAQKTLKKSGSSYDRPKRPRGDIKFYDTKKTKKAMPIATISDAYSAYAIYPQAKTLIDQSTLVKVEGKITIHSKPESRTEGFVFVMPEVHPAVSGFEIMLRWLFPVYDTFALYGRPDRLIPDRGATNGLMFAMPQDKRYDYLDILDVANLIHADGSDKWSEREWRKKMKEATRSRLDMVAPERMTGGLASGRPPSASFSSRNGVRYDDSASVRSQPGSMGHQHNQSTDAVFATPKKMHTAPAQAIAHNYHARSVSESVAFPSPTKSQRQERGYRPSRLSMEHQETPPAEAPPMPRNQWIDRQNNVTGLASTNSSDSELAHRQHADADEVRRELNDQLPPAPVQAPPLLLHHPGDKPQTRPDARPDLRREKSRMSNATLAQLVDANKNPATGTAAAGAVAAWRTKDSGRSESPAGVGENPNDGRVPANQSRIPEALADSRSASQHSVTRKPLPRSSSAHSANRQPLPDQPPPVPSIENGALEFPNGASLSVPQVQRKVSDTSQYSRSDYEEDVNPFADEHRLEKSRAGVLRTVGSSQMGDADVRREIPDVDFGPTTRMTPNISHQATSEPPQGRKTPVSRSRTPERKRAEKERQQSRSPVVWQPGSGRQSPGPSLSPADFVQQRAAAARSSSGYAIPQRSQTAVERPPSREMLRSVQRQQTMRTSSQEWSSKRLSAHDQEHISRMTGTPLVQVPPRQIPDPSVGLIGAIGAREQERRNMREGLANHAVQQNIAQRQAHQAAQLAFAQQSAQGGYGNPYQQPPNYNYSQQQPDYNYSQQQQAAWVDARQNGQWEHSRMQQQWGGQQPYPPQQQGQAQNGRHVYQQAYAGYYDPQEGQR